MTNHKTEKAIICPQCNAPLTPHRFGLSVVCSYCGATVQLDDAAISAERFRKAFQIWNSPKTYQISSWISVGNRHWAVKKELAQGEISNIYTGKRARFPTEFAILKILRDKKNIHLFDKEWDSLQTLHRSNAPGADIFTRLIPQPIVHGEVSAGSFKGQRISIFRWRSGFRYTIGEVIQAYPQGIPPRASIWVWRRILEILAFIHASNMVHGAVLPPHLLVQENEHGIFLAGYSRSGRTGEKLQNIPQNFEDFYPKSAQYRLTPQLDIVMSARSLIFALRGDPATASLPGAVPAPLAKVIRRVALDKRSHEDAWAIREELGKIAKEVFGASKFIPIVMPSNK